MAGIRMKTGRDGKRMESGLDRTTQRIAAITARMIFWTGKTICKGAAKTARAAYRHRKGIAQTTGATACVAGGGLKSVAEIIMDAASLLIYRKDAVEKLKRDLKTQADEYTRILRRNPALTTDMTIIGGVEMASLLSGSAVVPEEIIRAYESAYPTLASHMTLQEALDGKSAAQVAGMASAIKGKLFEIRYTDYLNDGHLPAGFSAHLAESATQPGFDIAIHGPDGGLAEVFQLKATDSVQYVREALARYPDIDVVTTDEVYGKLLMHGVATHGDIVNSGISDVRMEQHVADALHSGGGPAHLFDTHLPILSLALIAFSEYTKKDKGIYRKSLSFGERSVKVTAAFGAGAVLAAATGVWWTAPAGALGVRYLFDKGRAHRISTRKLKKIVKENARIIRDMRARSGTAPAC